MNPPPAPFGLFLRRASLRASHYTAVHIKRQNNGVTGGYGLSSTQAEPGNMHRAAVKVGQCKLTLD